MNIIKLTDSTKDYRLDANGASRYMQPCRHNELKPHPKVAIIGGWGGLVRGFEAGVNIVIAMNTARTVLAELEDCGVAFDASEPEHARRLLNLDHAAGEFLSFIVRATRRRRILEIGTSNGCSTIWLAMALSELANDGRLITIERRSDKQKAAIENVRRAGLENFVEFRLGEATEIVHAVDGLIDCVFFDADRVSAHYQLHALLPQLALDSLLITDNALSHAAELRGYFDLLATRADFQTLTLPIGKGLHVAHRKLAPQAW